MIGSFIETSDSKIEFTVDHPFLFFISESSTGVILFSGMVKNLQAVYQSLYAIGYGNCEPLAFYSIAGALLYIGLLFDIND